jgi:hypothetical protein
MHLVYNTTGAENTAVGAGALTNVTTGFITHAVGFQTLLAVTTGNCQMLL